METILMMISILLVAVVLLQSGKAESASAAISGGNSGLFANRKERGGELFMSRFTYVLGLAFFVICFALGF